MQTNRRPQESRQTSTSRRSAKGTQRQAAPAKRRSQQAASARADKRRSSRANEGAIAMLQEDHRNVQQMFKDLDKVQEGDQATLQELVNIVCGELTVHTQLEEEIFYPAVKEAAEEPDGVLEALVEHGSAKELIAKLQAMQPEDESYTAAFVVLGEYVNHHIKEEESSIFPAARRSGLDLQALGEKMRERKEAIKRLTEPAASTPETSQPTSSAGAGAEGSSDKEQGSVESPSGRSRGGALRSVESDTIEAETPAGEEDIPPR